MRTVEEYRAKAREFEEMATATTQRADRAPGDAGLVRNFLDGQGLTGRFCFPKFWV